MNNDLIPPPSFHLFPLGQDGSSVVYTDELNSLPTVLQLDYEVTVLAARLAFLSQEFRQDGSFERADVYQKAGNIRMRQSRIFELQEALRQLWVTPNVAMIAQDIASLPTRPKHIYGHAAALYRACIIYSHTSMWPGQRLDTSPHYDTEIAVASKQILRMTREALRKDRAGCGWMVFPVFMASVAITDGGQRMLALEILRAIERTSIGRNTANTRRALAVVYEKQNEPFMITGQSLNVDWLEIMIEHDLMVVNFGL